MLNKNEYKHPHLTHHTKLQAIYKALQGDGKPHLKRDSSGRLNNPTALSTVQWITVYN